LAQQCAADKDAVQALDLIAATETALAYVHQAIKTAPNIGAGNGPLNH
jgi:hydroxymethylpyrimidine/phosphomethylpyrimidine kinase